MTACVQQLRQHPSDQRERESRVGHTESHNKQWLCSMERAATLPASSALPSIPALQSAQSNTLLFEGSSDTSRFNQYSASASSSPIAQAPVWSGSNRVSGVPPWVRVHVCVCVHVRVLGLCCCSAVDPFECA